MYRDKEFRVRRLDEVLADIRSVVRQVGRVGLVRRVFLCDGDAMVLPTAHLLRVLAALEQAFPDLQRVGIYANARDILKKPEEELRELVRHKLSIFYLGLESGSDRILRWIDKGATSEEMVAAVQKAQACGMKSSVIYLLGLGGRALWQENALESAKAVSAMNPNYLSALTVTVVPGTPLARARDITQLRPRNWDCAPSPDQSPFELPSPEEFAMELRLFLEHVDVKATVFRSNHASNYVPLAGRLPRDKARMIAELDSAIKHHRFKPEYLRGL